MGRNIVVQTPPNVTFSTSFKGGSVKAEFRFAPGFGGKYTSRFRQAQMFIDSEVVRCSTPKVPHKTGMLRGSGITGTLVGSGIVRWIAPYAAFQYWGTRRGIKGRQWFEEMKAAHGARIRRSAGQIIGG
jgi:hypothetical protein